MYLLERLEPVERRHVAALLHVLLCFLCAGSVVAALTSCSGDTPSGGNKKRGESSSARSSNGEGSDGVEELAEEVEELLEAAKEAGVSKKALEKADKYLEQAEEALEDDKRSKARKKYKIAKKAVAKAITAQKEVAKKIEEIADLRKKALANKKKAQEASAPTNAPDLWKEAEDIFKKAEAEVQNGTLRSVKLARSSFTEAGNQYEEAATAAAENEVIRVQAAGEKKAMAEMKSSAKEKKADEKASAEWLRAGQTERDADTLLASGQFRSAVDTFKQATQAYHRALETVTTQEDMDKYQAEAEQRDKEERARQEEERQRYLEDLAERREGEADTDDSDGGYEEDTLVDVGASLPLPDGFDAEICVQDLDSEDEEFLATHYKELTKSGILEYDPATGAVRLDYTLGKDVKADIQKRSIKKKAYLSFKHFLQGRKDTLGLTEEEQKRKSPFSFAGNSQGLVTFPVPFRCWARVDYYMAIGTMDTSGTFRNLLMFNPKKKSGFVAEWLRAGYMSGGNPKLSTRGLPRKFLGSANEWFDKTSEKGMRIEFRLGDPKSKKDPSKTGVFSVTYDLGGDEPQENKIRSAKYKRGLVGFQWSRVKFAVQELVITGILDKEKAVSTLRKKLRIKKEKKKPEEEEEENDPPESADAGKAKSGKKKDGFDF